MNGASSPVVGYPRSAFEPYEKLSPFEIKDKLAQLAKESAKKSALAFLNAGRGNPNWVATTPREAFFLLGQFAVEECKRVMDMPDIGGMPQMPGIAGRLEQFLKVHHDAPGAEMLQAMVPFAVKKFDFQADAFVHELVDSIIGDNYPVPDRMLVHAEKVVHEYLMWAMCDNRPPAGKFDLFAVEGGTAAMCYTFKSLMQNHILKKGDTIALGVPIFTPYIEIAELNDYEFKVVHVRATQENVFQYSDAELAKLEDPKVKAFFIVNPGNPSSAAISQDVIDKLAKLVKTKRKDLLILTDDVYGTFVPNFRSLMADLPRNTIGVYSYSKYFGCTGWRLGVIALHEDNIIDEMIRDHPKQVTKQLNKRYGSLTLEPEKLKFIDRMVADSRDVCLNHTAGLSLPQQVQMTLFSLFQMLDDDDSYRQSTMAICHRRFTATVEGLGVDSKAGSNPLFAAYYGIIDLEFWIKKYLGEDVADFVKKNYHPLDITYRLAHDHALVLLNGGGFEAPNWSVRVSFANLPDDVYDDIGRSVRAVAATYVEAYRFAHPEKPPKS
ncbi:bifunctional aspartate transaminase/aspartate 4-decarboxylase [Aquabacter sp. CN5-332]|uniref:bifunctional aspartate transaminase/aspartate 4-decarboxylase n=1 Tax=Aquabacter sp. CN5-332 TaxID=3156608 RepID=UPI0032B3163C